MRRSLLWDVAPVFEWLVPAVTRQHSGLIFKGRNAHFTLTFQPLKVRTLGYFIPLGTNPALMWCHIPEGRWFLLHCCDSLKIYETHRMVDFLIHDLLQILYMWCENLPVMEPGGSPLLSDSNMGYLRQCEIWVSHSSVEDSSLSVCCTVSTGKQLLMFWRSVVDVFPQVPFYCFHQSLSHHKLSCCITYSNYNCSWIFVFFKYVTQSGSSHFYFVWIFSLFCYCTVFFEVVLCFTHTHTHVQTDRQTDRQTDTDKER
jgi:hypothetical protein